MLAGGRHCPLGTGVEPVPGGGALVPPLPPGGLLAPGEGDIPTMSPALMPALRSLRGSRKPPS
jgi:hypothetical protein